MPNRIIRDWTDSLKIDSLKFEEEVLLLRLMMKADDFGNFHANSKMIKSLCFPLKDSIRLSDIDRWLGSLETAGLIRRYEAKGTHFLTIINFGQRLRQTKRLFPDPSEGQPLVIDPPATGGLKGREVESETEGEGEAPPAGLGVVVYNAESEILKNQIRFEEICMKTNTDFAAAKIVLRKYHLHLEEKEQYPKGKNAVFAGFEKWLSNEKNFTKNGQKLGTSEARNSKGSSW